ncbi:OmpA family protein [Desulfohalovibrio reitneri]|uniref:OmpA family protein n=1 Tax=Desulfohalovibrio reitneri TaxID=1307759 RepID=UPI0004A6C853|nr:OmpA family protein [Desulfohalovibrio reitneri]
MQTVFRLLTIALLAAMLSAGMGCTSKQSQSGLPKGATGAATEGQAAESAREGQEAMTQEEREALKQRELEERRLEEQRRARQEERRTEMMQEDMAELATMINFAFDSFELSDEARDILRAKAEILKEHEDLRLVIEGYCDNRGTEEYNLALGERRARAAYEYLVLLGISPNRMNIVSYGEEDPIDPANNEVAWAKNRRCEFKVVK